MRNFNYQPTYATRKATESHIREIRNEITAISSVHDVAMGYTTSMSIIRHLHALKQNLERDLKYFDAIDAAMEQAVK